MTKTLKNILIGILIGLILAVSFFIAGYQTAKHKYSKPINIGAYYDTIKVEYDTLKIRDTIHFPKPYAVIDTVIIPQFVDTSAIITDYFRIRQYLFSYPFGTISFNVSNNNLFDYSANFNIVSQRVFLRPKQLYGVGLSVGILVDKPYVEINGSYVNRTNMFTIGISYPMGVRIGYQFIFYKY